MIECKTEINTKAQKVLSKNIKLVSIIMLVIGCVGIAGYIIASCFVSSGYLDVMLVFALPFGYGLVYLVSVNNMIKKAEGNATVNHYQFEEDYFNASSSKNGEIIGTVKYYYKDIKKIKERDGYLLLYVNSINAFMVEESELSENDLTLLKSLLKIGTQKN